MTPTGSPAAVQCRGSETAGMPVTFHADVHGVNRFWFSKSREGSASSRMAPTGSGGTARGGGSTASYGARAARAWAAKRRMAPIASPNSGPDTARPRSVSQRVSGLSDASRSGGTTESAVSTAQQVSNTGTASGGSGTGTSTTSWPSEDSSADASSQARATSGSTGTSAITGSMNRATRS